MLTHTRVRLPLRAPGLAACVNLKSRQGIEALKALIKAADVLIDPFRPGVLERLGMAPQTLLEEVRCIEVKACRVAAQCTVLTTAAPC